MSFTSKAEQKDIRKDYPIWDGLFVYFPDALLYVSWVSASGNEQHNPGTSLHWDRDKSTDEKGSLLRHLQDIAKGEKMDSDGVRHAGKVAWRALANLQKELEADNWRPE